MRAVGGGHTKTAIRVTREKSDGDGGLGMLLCFTRKVGEPMLDIKSRPNETIYALMT